MRRPAVLLALLAGSLAGCFGTRDPNEGCDDLAEYQASGEVTGLQVPEGLEAPKQTSAYAVPGASGADQRGAACLARPPPYFRPAPAAATPPAAQPAAAPAE